jgi:hypothetical protein
VWQGAADHTHDDATFRAPPHHQIADHDLHGVASLIPGDRPELDEPCSERDLDGRISSTSKDGARTVVP